MRFFNHLIEDPSFSGLSAMKKMVGTGTAEEAAATMEELATLLELNAEVSDTFSQVPNRVQFNVLKNKRGIILLF